jgi:hypothetical protein
MRVTSQERRRTVPIGGLAELQALQQFQERLAVPVLALVWIVRGGAVSLAQVQELQDFGSLQRQQAHAADLAVLQAEERGAGAGVHALQEGRQLTICDAARAGTREDNVEPKDSAASGNITVCDNWRKEN